MSVANRNVMYAIEGGVLHIYDTDNDRCRDRRSSSPERSSRGVDQYSVVHGLSPSAIEAIAGPRRVTGGPLRPPFLLRSSLEMMRRGLLHARPSRKRQREGSPVIVGVPLIVVVVVEDIARLAVHDVEGRPVQVGEVDRQPLRRPELAATCLMVCSSPDHG